MRIRVRVSNTQQFDRLAARLRAAAGDLEPDLGQGLQGAAPPVLAAVQARVLNASFPAAPSRGGSPPTGFRAGLAGATKTEPLSGPVGVRFTVDGDAVGRPRGHKLATYTEGIARGRWRHQVYGNPNAWVNQLPDPWFFPTIAGREEQFRRVVEQVMDRTARTIMR